MPNEKWSSTRVERTTNKRAMVLKQRENIHATAFAVFALRSRRLAPLSTANSFLPAMTMEPFFRSASTEAIVSTDRAHARHA